MYKYISLSTYIYIYTYIYVILSLSLFIYIYIYVHTQTQAKQIEHGKRSHGWRRGRRGGVLPAAGAAHGAEMQSNKKCTTTH